MPTEYRPAPTGDRAPSAMPPPSDPGWRLRQLHPGRWYAVNGSQAVWHYDRFRSRWGTAAHA